MSESNLPGGIPEEESVEELLLEPEGPLSLDEEALFARDPFGKLVRVDAPTQADLTKTVRIRIDGSDWIDVPKAVPLTDAQGNIRYDDNGNTLVRPTTIYDAARLLQPPISSDSLMEPSSGPQASASQLEISFFSDDRSLSEMIVQQAAPPGSVVRIPVLCHQDHLNPVAVCRICTVQVVGIDPRDPNKRKEQRKLLPACQHRVEDGMEVHTMWSDNQKYRKLVRRSVQVLYEMLAGDHVHTDRDSELRNRGERYRNELAELKHTLEASWQSFLTDAESATETADYARICATEPPRFPMKPAKPELLVGWVDDSRLTGREAVNAPPFVVDYNNCIVCDRCIRACSEVKPFKVIGRSGKGPTTRIAFDLADLPMAESSCRACGECMTACPTGAISFQYRIDDVRPDRGVESNPNNRVIEPDELLDHPLFKRMSRAFLEWNRGAVRRRLVEPGDVIGREGEFGTHAYILEEGFLAICRKNVSANPNLPHLERTQVSQGLKKIPSKYGPPIWVQAPDPEDVIGEMAPMSHARRNASLVAITSARVLEIERNVLFVMLRDPVSRDILDRRYARRALIEFFPKLGSGPGLFGVLERSEIQELLSAIEPYTQLVRCTPGFVICREGEAPDDFYLIRLGFVGISSTRGGAGWLRPPLKQGDCFGEVALITSSEPPLGIELDPDMTPGIRMATCVALDHAELVRVPGAPFYEFLQAPENETILRKLWQRALRLNRGGK